MSDGRPESSRLHECPMRRQNWKKRRNIYCESGNSKLRCWMHKVCLRNTKFERRFPLHGIAKNFCFITFSVKFSTRVSCRFIQGIEIYQLTTPLSWNDPRDIDSLELYDNICELRNPILYYHISPSTGFLIANISPNFASRF